MQEEMNFGKKEEGQAKSIQEEIMEKQRAELEEGNGINEEKGMSGDNASEMRDEEGGGAAYGAPTPETSESRQAKKMKNLISITILLFGLFVGSLFVDMSQLVRGSGYSQKNLNKSDIFEANGKTWVAYDAPAVPASVLTDDSCKNCDPSDVLVWLRRVMPTISVTKVNYDSEQGKKMIENFGIKTLPAFVFDPAVEKTELYSEAKDLFTSRNGQDVMNGQLLGIPVGKYLSIPSIDAGDATIGNANSKVKVVVFSDFQCPYCKSFFTTLQAAIKKYQDKVEFVFKDLPLSIHPQAGDAALAASCAQDQGKFWEFADKLYATQSQWGNAKDITYFKNYAAAMKLDTAKFNDCLDKKTHQDKISAVQKEADSFGISGTPTIFINDQVETGVVSADQFTKDIEAALNK